jgi:hypothetical protein
MHLSRRNLLKNGKENLNINSTSFRLRAAKFEATTKLDVDLKVIVLSLVKLQDQPVG